MPIEHVTGCLFRVARNRITDLFRKKRPESLGSTAVTDEDGEVLRLEDLLPSPDDGPEAIYARNVLLDELELAVEELPAEQREVFVAHELEGRSFKAMAAETGVRCGEDAPRLRLVDASTVARTASRSSARPRFGSSGLVTSGGPALSCRLLRAGAQLLDRPHLPRRPAGSRGSSTRLGWLRPGPWLRSGLGQEHQAQVFHWVLSPGSRSSGAELDNHSFPTTPKKRNAYRIAGSSHRVAAES